MVGGASRDEHDVRGTTFDDPAGDRREVGRVVEEPGVALGLLADVGRHPGAGGGRVVVRHVPISYSAVLMTTPSRSPNLLGEPCPATSTATPCRPDFS